MAGFDNGTVFADNVDFRGVKPVVPQVTADGELLIGSTASPNIKVGSLTSTGGTVTVTAGSGTINLEAGASTPVQFDTDSGSAIPALGILNVLGATGLSTSGASNTVTIAGSSAGVNTWVNETGTTADFVAGQGVIANNGSGITITLPATAAQGTVIRVAGVGAGGWTIDQGTGQSINYLGTSTTVTSGTLAGDEVNACLELLCIVADTTWLALSSTGNFTIT